MFEWGLQTVRERIGVGIANGVHGWKKKPKSAPLQSKGCGTLSSLRCFKGSSTRQPEARIHPAASLTPCGSRTPSAGQDWCSVVGSVHKTCQRNWCGNAQPMSDTSLCPVENCASLRKTSPARLINMQNTQCLCGPQNNTTTYRWLAKSSPTFCVFLLTTFGGGSEN